MRVDANEVERKACPKVAAPTTAAVQNTPDGGRDADSQWIAFIRPFVVD